MKKIISALVVVLILCSFGSVQSFALDYNYDNCEFSSEMIVDEVHGLYDFESTNEITTYSTSLFKAKSITLSKTSTQLIITAQTTGIEEVTKAGFTYIKLQRLINGAWTDYSTYCYYDQFSNSNNKTFSKTISAPKGYTYRVVCEHYVEKPRLIVFKTSETSYNQTSSLSF
ncbi:MAG: hypothetical protein ACI4KD_05255 [Oscillospiraceae bacterium]